jgi:tRNA nucleotidyltransferase (CCA-adding enzyme)
LTDFAAIIAKAVTQCEPTRREQEKITQAAERCKKLVEEQTAGNDNVVSVLFGGSYAKGTWLRGDADVDVFIKIRPSVDVGRFEELGKGIGLAALKRYGPKLRYSDHPYVEAYVNGIRVNVVPCYDVEQGKWQSAADRSPFHTDYVIRNFGIEMRAQTRLLKRFLKSAGIYGAEISVGGLSGYVCEVLVMKYKSFEKIMDAAAHFQEHQVISVSGQYDPDVVKGFSSPLVIIDPIDDRRNLGTAVSPESLGKFILAARSFISRPSLRFFDAGKKAGPARRKLEENILVVEFRHRERSPDIVWGQLKRSLAAICKQLEIADFCVMRSSCLTDEKTSAVMVFLLESLVLSPFAKRRGPEVFRKDDSSSFLSSPKNEPHIVWVDSETRLAMLVDRKETDALAYVKSLFGKRLANSGISKDLLAPRKMLRIYSGRGSRMSSLAKEAVDEVVSTEHFIFRRI